MPVLPGKIRGIAFLFLQSSHVCLQINSTDQVILGISDEEQIARLGQTLRPVKTRFFKCSIYCSTFTCSDRVNQRPVELGDDQAIVIRVSDEEPAAGRVRQDFSWKGQWQIADLCTFQNQLQWLFVELTAFSKLIGELCDGTVEHVVVSFARDASNDVPFWIDQDLRGPGMNAIALPDTEFCVVVNRMFKFVAKNDVTDVFGILFVLKLCRMDTDDYELVGVFRLEFLEVRDDMDAVDAAIGPEVEENELAFEAPLSTGAYRYSTSHGRR